jgi:hypothetical protein
VQDFADCAAQYLRHALIQHLRDCVAASP